MLGSRDTVSSIERQGKEFVARKVQGHFFVSCGISFVLSWAKGDNGDVDNVFSPYET
jgi:hypothetical protein